MRPSIYDKARLILGCGNPLFGDDGFGAEVIGMLETVPFLPDDVACLDVGTAVRDILFDIILAEKKPDQIIIIDAMSLEGAVAGEIREIGLDDIQADKICDYSLHQFPTTNLLKEIRELTPIDVRILVVHPENIPPEVRPGLSESVLRSVPVMCRRILGILRDEDADIPGQDPQTFEFRIGALAERIGVHRNTIANWIKKGRFRATPTVGRKYRVEAAELKRFCRESGLNENIFQDLERMNAGGRTATESINSSPLE